MKRSAPNSTNMKFRNKFRILNIIRKSSVSRAELSRMIGLTRAAITLIVDELIQNGILVETGTAEAEFGRKPILLDLNPDYGYSLGVSILRNGCMIGVFNFKGALLRKKVVSLKGSFDADVCIKIIIKELKKIISVAGIPYEKILGIGINAPGPIDIYSGTILNPPNFKTWHNVQIVQEIKKVLPLNIYLENNSTSLALAENNYGSGAQFSSFMLIVVDSGVGSGIIINDQLYRGVGGFGSEVGHTSINMNGIQCSCGNRGCLEVYTSIPSVLKRINKCGMRISTWNEIVDEALNGNELCMKAIDMEAHYLSVGIVNAMNILELEAVILAGDINYRGDLIVDKIRNYVSRTVMTRNINKIKIINSSIVENSEIIAAASVVNQRFFQGEID